MKVKGAKREFMVCGRVVARSESDEVYDYVAVVYSEGLLDINNLYFLIEMQSKRVSIEVMRVRRSTILKRMRSLRWTK